jgi:putative intracellular protease/amidase
MTTSAHLLAVDGYADWEPALALCELRRSGGADVTVVGFTRDPVRSMGGVPVQPHRALDEVRPEDVSLFLVPGGELWEDASSHPCAELSALLRKLESAGVPIAGICAGTIALARAGLLDDRAHTSNLPGYLSAHAPTYRGAERYVGGLAARDRGVVTASGLGYVEFAREIFAELDVLTPEQRDWWHGVYKTGEWTDPPGVE